MGKVNGRIMALFHKIHEMSLFYLLLSTVIGFKNYDSSIYLHKVSVAVSCIVLGYYLVYELKIFYDMIPYPQAKINTSEYLQFLRKYSFFIAYYRFEEYNVIIF